MSITVKDILAALGLLGGIIPGLKKKPHKLLVWNAVSKKWERTHDGSMSARQCRKLVMRLVETGSVPLWRYTIVRDSVHEADIPEPKESLG